jgi:hypothetical protein
MFTESDWQWVPWLPWMPSRIPIRDALSTFLAPDSNECKPPWPVYETRYFPRPNGTRVLIPYDGESFDETQFKLEPGAWDHDTCNNCNAYIKAMTLCYVTKNGPFYILCHDCYGSRVVRRLGMPRILKWHLKRWFGHEGAA